MKGTKVQTLDAVACACVGLRLPASYTVDWEPADIKLAHVPQVYTPRSLAHTLYKMADCMNGYMRGCWILATENKYCDLCCPLSM